MHSIAAVRSVSGAANYFASDNYYTDKEHTEVSEWGGKGAEELGLKGEVSKSDFEAVLDGKLPDGTVVNAHANRRAGLDLTFSMPKSASIMAYIAGDKRILSAHMKAVKATMKHVEKQYAENRDYSRDAKNGEGVRSGNLVYALFEHDTSRKLDPQGHIHAVVAAITQNEKGEWRALFNGQIWENNTRIGSAYHAQFRAELEKLGYDIKLTGKHGQFEIKGVPQNVIDAFSQRREEILSKANELGVSGGKALDNVTKMSRDPKLDVEDRGALREEWREKAAELGFDGKDLMVNALLQADNIAEKPLKSFGAVAKIIDHAKTHIKNWVRPPDSLMTNGLKRIGLTPTAMRTEMAVASAIRILGQREAAFKTSTVQKTALDLGYKGVTHENIEKRVTALLKGGQLIAGESDRLDKTMTHMTTPGHIASERQLLKGIDTGRRQAPVIVKARDIQDRLTPLTKDRPLNGEQLGAASLALSTQDRIAVIQGVAGAGKTTLISAMSQLAEQEGKKVIGLAFANKMVGMLRDEAGIEAQTVSSFVNEHIKGALAGQGDNHDSSKATLKDTILVLDESSLVANEPMNNLVTIANNLGVDRLVMIGDRKQLQPIDAGKAFSLVQSHEPAMAKMNTSLRQTTDHMKQVAVMSRAGKFRETFDILGDRVQSEEHNIVSIAADKWLGLSPEERDKTALYASGRIIRGDLNRMVQAGLKEEGTIGKTSHEFTTLISSNLTREELRYPHVYKAGQIAEVFKNGQAGSLKAGRYEVIGKDKKDRILLRDEKGKEHRFDPQEIKSDKKYDALALYDKEKVKLHDGDKIRWTANDKERGLLNSDAAKIINIDKDKVTVENAKGEKLDLKPNDIMLERMGLSYAINMHQAQGMTTDKGIGVMHSSERQLASQRLTHVMATRVREDISIVTDDKEKLIRTIEGNSGNKMSALEVTGEKSIDKNNAGKIQERLQPLSIRDLEKAKPNKNVTPEMRASMKPGPEITMPERNIERSR